MKNSWASSNYDAHNGVKINYANGDSLSCHTTSKGKKDFAGVLLSNGIRQKKVSFQSQVVNGHKRIVLQNVELQNAELQNVENTKRRITKRQLQNVESNKRENYKTSNYKLSKVRKGRITKGRK
jgi:hypothetical protein